MKRYEKYKYSGIDWIGEIPEHWESIRLKYIGYLYGGLAGKSANDFNQESNFNNKPFIPFTNICNNKIINPTQLQYVVIAEDEQQNQVAKGDLFFMMSSENFDDVGKSSILLDDLEETYLNSFCKGFRFTTEKYYPPFINYLLLSKAYRSLVLTEANGYTRINLKIDKINDIPLKTPPTLDEQIAIANYLDLKTEEIDQLIKQKEELLLLFEEEKTAIINHAVTKGINPVAKLKDSKIDWLGEIPEHWILKKLKYVAQINPTKDNFIDKESIELVVFLPMEKVKETGEIDCELKRPIQELWNGFTFFRRNDVIIAKITPCFENGKGAFLKNLETEFGFGSTEFHVLRSNKAIMSKYLFYLTRSELFMKIGEAFMIGAAGQKRVPTDFISEFKFPIPPKEEQEQILEFIDTETSRIYSKVEKTKRLIEQLKEYKTALISEVSTGKVKVN
ncbi:restriction endonuclease subunit S [Bacteroidota bacterium]